MNPFLQDKLNIDFGKLSWVHLYEEARAKDQLIKASQEKQKAYTLRGGSAGCVLQDGNFIGAHPWETLARFMGYQVPKTKSSLDIFDGGFGNESNWDRVLQKTNGKFEFTGDTAYPLKIDNFVKGYPLTGRPDGVAILMENGQPIGGVEHKGVFGASTAEKVLSGRPKTENLIQAGVYSIGFNLPWSLVYSNSSNFKTYKAPAGPGKAEYHIAWIDGVLCFNWQGQVTETVIDVRGIYEFYEALVDAYEMKDHSWFKRESADFLGEPEPYDMDIYNEFNLLVDSTSSWADWVEQIAAAETTERIIRYKTYKRQHIFQVTDVKTNRVLVEYDDLNDARNAVRATWRR